MWYTYINTTDRVQRGAFIIYITFSAAVGDIVLTVNCTAHTLCTLQYIFCAQQIWRSVNIPWVLGDIIYYCTEWFFLFFDNKCLGDYRAISYRVILLSKRVRYYFKNCYRILNFSFTHSGRYKTNFSNETIYFIVINRFKFLNDSPYF